MKASLKSNLALFMVTFWSLSGQSATGTMTKDVLRLALRGEPPNLDSAKATDHDSVFVLGHTMEGLTRYSKGKIAPGVAERWEINSKGATFYLRKNAKWSDGKPVTSHDFVYAWKTALDPKTASTYAFILYPIKNAEAINTGKLPIDKIGAEAVSDTVLKISFEKPCGYFLALTTFVSYFPQREDFRKSLGDKYAAEASNLLYNGPYTLKKWVHGASLLMEKNPNYWNANAVTIRTIDIPYITPEDSAIFNLFKDKKIDAIDRLNKETLVTAQRENFKLKKFSEGTLFYMEFNFRQGRLTQNKNLRKAIEALVNPTEYVSRVVGIPGTQPGTGLVPSWMMGVQTLFSREYPVSARKQNLVAAKKYLQDAMKDLGLKSPPSLVWLTSDTPLAAKEAEYFQGLFKSVLGINLKIDQQIFKQRLAKQRAGEFDICSGGWGPDYNDPMTYIDLFASWNGNNHGQFKNSEYDKLVLGAQATTNQPERMKLMGRAQKLLMDETVLVPLYERTVVYTHSENLEGITRNTFSADPDFTQARFR